VTSHEAVLSGIRVVEVSAFVAAPFAGAILAGLGADVIRVEQVGGGIDARRWPLHEGRSLYREGLDRGKRTIEVDLRSDEGRALVHDIVASGGDEGGVVLTNLPARGWLSYEALSAVRSDVILVTIVGHSDGRPAVDYTVNAAVGFPFVTGAEETEGPVNHVLPAWDIGTGLLAATSLLAAERHRRTTGEGQLVELALADVATAVAAHLGYVAEARLVAEPRARYGNFVYGTLGKDFPTLDGRRVMVCALTPRQWRGLGDATGLGSELGALADEVGADFLSDDGSRFEHRGRIAELLEPWFAARTLAEVADALDAHGVLWSPYRTFKELAADDLVSDRYASPVAFSAFERAQARDAPAAGESAASILRDDLGLDESALADLRARGIVGAG
jgi:2-methylfumaryl-CoA isomerase